MIRKTVKEKLLKLADFLETKVQDDWFDLGDWATRGFTEKECGTTACAVGWATVCFSESNLRLKKMDSDTYGIYYTDRDNEESIGFAAVSDFFEIDIQDAEYLFDPTHYFKRTRRHTKPHKEAVILRIREFVERDS